MQFNFSQALEAIAKGCTSAYNSVRERVLPTPGKRKRSDSLEAGQLGNKRVSRARLMQPPAELDRETAVNPPSQFATAAKAPTIDAVTAAEPLQQKGYITPQPAALQPHSKLPGIVDYHSPQLGYFMRPLSYSRVHSKTPRLPASRRSRATTRKSAYRPWQRRYAALEFPSPYGSYMPSLTDVPFAPFARQAQAERFSLKPGSALWGSFRGVALGPRGNRSLSVDTAAEDLKEKELLRQMTRAAMEQRTAYEERIMQHAAATTGPSGTGKQLLSAHEPGRQEGQVHLAEPSTSQRELGFARSPRGHQPRQASQPKELVNKVVGLQDMSLAVGKFELEQIKRDRWQSEQLQKERLEALTKCDELMGDKQEQLLARVSAALGEKSVHNAAAEISKASMKTAQEEGRALYSTPELDFLEHQQHRLSEFRMLQRAQREAVSATTPATDRLQKLSGAVAQGVPKQLPAVKAPQKQEERKGDDDVVDLISSSDDEAEEADTRATSQGQAESGEGFHALSSSESEAEEASQGQGEEEEEEEEVEDDEAEHEDLNAKLAHIGVRDRDLPPHFLPLTKKHMRLYNDAMNHSKDQDAEIRLHPVALIGVNRRLLACLRPRTWLNDEVINFFIGLLQERDKLWRPLKSFPKCHFFSTFFFNKLYLDTRNYDYSAVCRWTRPQKLQRSNQESNTILECDRIILPVHLGVHWTCAMADLQRKEFVYYDSMLGKERGVMGALQKYIADEYKEKCGQSIDTTIWPIKYPQDVPMQQNGCDCGVFTLMFAEHLARGASLEFDQMDMEYFRVMITAAIMDLKIPDLKY